MYGTLQSLVYQHGRSPKDLQSATDETGCERCRLLRVYAEKRYLIHVPVLCFLDLFFKTLLKNVSKKRHVYEVSPAFSLKGKPAARPSVIRWEVR